MKTFYLILLITFTTLSTSMAESIPGDSLLNFFSSTCTSLGGYTSAALNDARALMETLKSIRDDGDCKSVSGAISQLGNLESKLLQLDNEYYKHLEVAKLEAQEIELMAQIGKTQDPLSIDLLRSSLTQVQIDKASYLADERLRIEYDGGKLRNVYTQIIKSTSTAYNTIVSNQLCLKNNPGILSAATSLTGTIAASTALINPALGFGIAGLTDFIGNTIEYYKDKGYNSQIKYIADRSTIPIGLTCALETLTNRQCDIDDAKKFLAIEENINQTKRNYESNSQIENLKKVSKLFDIDVPVILDWFEKVQAGAPASNTADSSRREEMFSKQMAIKVARSRGEGLFSENENLFNAETNPKLKYQYIKSVIINLGSSSDRGGGFISHSSSGSSNPLFDIYSMEYAPYYLLGLDAPIRNDFGSIKSFSDFDPFLEWPNGQYVPDFKILITRYQEWLSLAEDKVNQKLFTTLQPDPLKILADYKDITSNTYKRSPHAALQNILAFLNSNRPDDKDYPIIASIFNSTIDKLKRINQAVIETFKNESNCLMVRKQDEYVSVIDIPECNSHLKIIKTVFEEAQLESGKQVMKNRLESSLRIALHQFILQTDPKDEENNQIAQFLAADTFLDQLKRINGKSNPALIMADLDMADVTTQNNLNNFGFVFGEIIRNNMANSQNQFLSNDPDISKPYRKTRAKLCLLLAAIPDWPQTGAGGLLQYCEGLSLQDLQDGPQTPIITRDLIDAPLSKRKCIYRDYQRKNKIFKEWNIKL